MSISRETRAGRASIGTSDPHRWAGSPTSPFGTDVTHVAATPARIRHSARQKDKSNRSVHGMVHGHIPMTSNVSSTPPRTHLRVAWSMVTPRDEPLFMDLWTWSLREAARGSRVQRPAPHHSERVPPPLKPHAPSSPQLLSTMRASAHMRYSGNAAHAERGPTCMCVRRAPSRANMHATYRQNAAHGHRNPDRAWEEPS